MTSTTSTSTVTASQQGMPVGPFRISGAVLGLLILFAGLGMVFYVFSRANSLLMEAPAPVLPAPPPAATTAATAAADNDATAGAINLVTQSLVDFVKRFLLLLLMCIAGSVIASRGIEIFFKSCIASPALSPAPSSAASQPTKP